MSKRTVVPNLIPAFIALALLVATSQGSIASAKDPDAFIQTVGQQAIDSLTRKEISDKQREEGFRTILNQTFEVPLIAKFTLGRYWRRANEEQRKEYVRLFEDFIVQAYAARFKDYNGEKFSVGKVRAVDDRDSLVQSQLILKDGKVIVVYWRVRGKDEPKIIDVIVEGVSMAITQRDEFSAIINQNGGKIDGLLTALRKKTGQ